MRRFDEIESVMSKSMQRKRVRIEGEDNPELRAEYNKGGTWVFEDQIDDRTTETGGLKPLEKELFVVASFNDWMPMRLKTNRAINLEKYPVYDEDIPREIFQLDNSIAVYANMVPPGQHFFYLCQQKGRIFLSPRYEIVKFKKTNVYLNRIIIKNRLEDIDTVHIAKDALDEELIFMKDRSVFKDFRDDTNQHIQKCFEQDMEYGKLWRIFKKTPETYEKVKEILL